MMGLLRAEYSPAPGWAREIMLHWPLYRTMSPQEIGLRIDVPLHLGFAHVVPDPGIFFSWSWIKKGTGAFNRMAFGHAPLYDDWSRDGEVLWLMDVAARPGVSGFEVGRTINSFMVGTGMVSPGTRAAFRRHRGRRFGYATAQEVD